MNRIIGRYIGEQKGPLFIAMGALHGNEIAGPKAIKQVIKMLEDEAEHNSDFIFNGQFIGFLGNIQAIQTGQRFIEKDMNRQWTPYQVQRVLQQTNEPLTAEDLEIKELFQSIQKEIDAYAPEMLIFLDLHTTSAEGGIFSIVSEDLRSLQIAVQLHAPVITGMIGGLKGTTLHYFSQRVFDIPTTTLVFESGQHDDPKSVDRAVSAIINCLRAIGCVHHDVVEEKHDQLLIEYARQLPKVTELIYVHKINKDDQFVMRSGYKNFQEVAAGEILAHDKNGDILCQEDAIILMPLYQPQGENGFFLVKEVYQGAY